MSNISNVDEAVEALCQGEFFQVEGTPMNPDEIIWAEKDSKGQPIFHLQDGSTRTHNQYIRGDVGDLLYEALTVAVRKGNQSEVIAPNSTVNSILFQVSQGSIELDEFGDENGNKVSDWFSSGQNGISHSPTGYSIVYLTVGDSPAELRKYDKDGNQLWTTGDVSGTGTGSGIVFLPERDEVYWSNKREPAIRSFDASDGSALQNQGFSDVRGIRRVPDKTQMLLRNNSGFQLLDGQLNTLASGNPLGSDFNGTYGYAIDPSGNVVFANSDGNDNTDGIYKTTLSDLGNLDWRARTGLPNMYGATVAPEQGLAIGHDQYGKLYAQRLSDGANKWTQSALDNGSYVQYQKAEMKNLHVSQDGFLYAVVGANGGKFRLDGSMLWSVSSLNEGYAIVPIEEPLV